MKKALIYLSFAVIPIVILLLSIYLRAAQGPHWLGSTVDPDYAYLFNSLSLSKGYPIGHFDHPGTPVQMLGSLTIRVLNVSRGQPDMIADVVKNPELYLNSLQNLILAINILVVLFVGILSYKITKNSKLAILMQLTPFLTMNMLYSPLVKVDPEALLFGISLSFALLLLYITYSKNLKLSLIFFSFLIGLGTATKLTFFPLIIIPLIIIKGFKKKLALLAGTALSFYFFTKPIVSDYPALWEWVKSLFFHSGRNGEGAATIVAFSSVVSSLKDQITSEPIFIALSLIGLVLIYVYKFSKNKKELTASQKSDFSMLAAVVIAQLVQILFVAKHAGPAYLIPVLGLSSVSIILIWRVTKDSSFWQKNILSLNKATFIISVVLLVALFRSAFLLKSSGDLLEQTKAEQMSAYTFVHENYPNDIIIRYHRSTDPLYGLKFGNIFVHDEFSNYLDAIYPNSYFWDIWNARLTSWSSVPVSPDSMIKKDAQRLIFQGTSFELQYSDYPNYKPNIDLKDVYGKAANTQEHETVYQYDLPKLPVKN